MTIVITGVGGFRNRGVGAFTIPTVEQLQKQFPGEEIAILTPTPEYDGLRLRGSGVSLVRNDFSLGSGSPRLQQVRRTAAKLLGRQPRSEGNAANRLLKTARMVVALGGDIFSSDYGELYRHLAPLAYAQQHDVPVVFLAHSIGPFRTQEESEAWARVARKAALVTVRESRTYTYITEKLKVPPDLVKLTADPAFLLDPPSSSTVAAMQNSYAVHGRSLVALAISRNISTWRQLGSENHLQAWHNAIHALWNLAEVQVLLVPHVQDVQAMSDDRIIATELLRRLDYDARLRLIGGDHSASELKGLIGSCDLVIAERMHAAIAGLSSGVPTVAVGYSVKAEGIMADLIDDESLRARALIAADDFVSAGRSEQVVRQAWEARHSIQRSLVAALPAVRVRARENYSLLRNLRTVA